VEGQVFLPGKAIRLFFLCTGFVFSFLSSNKICGKAFAVLSKKLLNLAKDQGLLSLPLVLPHNLDFLVLQYADDTLIFRKADAIQLFFLKWLEGQFP
jgi:hypothetical protein